MGEAGRGEGVVRPTPARLSITVMAGLVPAIHVLVALRKQGVDARRKAGHDEA